MNNIRITLLSFIIILLGSSCGDLLDKQPLDQLTTDLFYRTAADADKAVLAAYSPMLDQEWIGTLSPSHAC